MAACWQWTVSQSHQTGMIQLCHGVIERVCGESSTIPASAVREALSLALITTHILDT